VVNRVYNLFKEDKKLSKDFKMIGIAIGNQPDELSSYKKAFKVDFPLYVDPKKEIAKKAKVPAVPHTILVDKNGKVLMNHSGPIENFDAYVMEIKKNLQAQ
jgi:hypothetical protein